MKKRLISLITVLAMMTAFVVLPTVASAASGTCGTNLTWTYSGSTLTISGTGAMSSYTISNDPPWDSYKSSITTLTINSGVTSIGNYAFTNLHNVTSITIPDTVTSIGEYSFFYCSKLSSVKIGSGVTKIGALAFNSCEKLTTFEIPDNVTTIGSQAFGNCSKLTSVSIGSGLKYLVSPAFLACYVLENIEVSEDNETFCSVDGVLFNKEMTTLYQYPPAKTASTYDIPSTVTAINQHAFSNAVNLTHINIPDKVTSIGNYAFSMCSALTSIDLPSNITSIANWALSGCTSLTSVEIPSKVTSIGSGAFANCSGLTSMDISANVTSIGERAFANCGGNLLINVDDNNQYYSDIDGVLFNKSATELIVYAKDKIVSDYTIPSSVTTFDEYAFACCSALTSIEIPRTITSISPYAFRSCSSLVDVNMALNITDIGNYAFYECTALTEITLPTGVTTIGKCAFYGCSNMATVVIPDNVTEISDYAFRNCTGLTTVYYTGSEDDWNAITIGTYNTALTSATIYYDYELYETPAAGAIGAVTMTRDGVKYNLLTTAQTFEKDSDDSASIVVSVNWGKATAGRILLSQNSGTYLESTDGNFDTITPGTTFDTGDAIYAIAVDDDGNIIDSKRVYLQVTEPVTTGSTGGSEWEFSLFDVFSFTIPDDKPVLGNQTFSLDFGKIGADLEMSDGTFKATIGVNFEKDEDGKFGDAEFKNFKETVKETRKNILAGAMTSTIHYSLLKKGYGCFDNIEIDSGWNPKAAIMGYIEGKVTNDGTLVPTEGGIIVSAELTYKYEGQAFVVVVPVYYSIEAGGEIKVTAGIKGMVAGSGFKPMFSGDLTIAPHFEIGGGLGVVYLAQVGARGNATLTFDIALDDDYRKVDLTGTATFEVKVFSFKVYGREFAKGTWTIYETGRVSTASLDSAEDIYASIDFDAPVVPEDRSYVDNPTVWLGEETVLSLMSTDYTNKELRVLQTNAYPDAKPQLMEVDGTTVMVWVADDTSRTDINKSELVYSIYDADSDTWSEPLAIMDNGMADYYPVAKDGYVVWQKAATEFDEDVTLTEVAQNTDIYIAKFNGTAFDTPVQLTDNDIIDTQPQIAVNGDNVTVVWTQNTENNILGYEGTNSIWQITYDGSTWSDAQELAEGLNTVAYLEVGYMDDAAVVAYSYEEDNDLNTIDDREIYLIRDGVTTQFTDNDVLDSHPVIENINGTPALFWYSENNVYYVTDLDDPTISTISADGIDALTDDYTIASNGDSTAILWTNVSDGVSEVYGALYDGLQWSNDVTITQTGESARYPSGIINDDGDLLIAFNRIENVEEDDYYTDGQADLCVINVTPSYDISIDDIYIGADAAPNTDVPVYVTVTNSGELPVDTVSVEILDVNGEQNTQTDFDETIQPGESVELEVYYTIGDTVEAGDITAVVSTSSGSEYNEDNNQVTAAIGQSDIAVTDITDEADGDSHAITVTLANQGYTTATGVEVSLLDGSDSGEVIETASLGDVEAQAETTVTFDVNAADYETEYSFIILTALVTSESEDNSSGNNFQTFTIDKESETSTAEPTTEPTATPTAEPTETPSTEKTLSGIHIESLPDNTTVIEGMDIDTTGLIIMADYSDGTSEAVTDYTLTLSSEVIAKALKQYFYTSNDAKVALFVYDNTSDTGALGVSKVTVTL